LPFDYTLQESFQIVRGSGVFKEGEKGEGEEGEEGEGEGEEGGEGVLAVAAPSACCCIEILNSEL